MASCPVCGKSSATCTSKHYRPPLVPDLLNEGGPYVAKATENVIKMPQQHVRSGRGTPGYKSTDEAKVEVYKTERPASFGGPARPATKRTTSRRSSARSRTASKPKPETGGTIDSGGGEGGEQS